jgi:hypothetical protein
LIEPLRAAGDYRPRTVHARLTYLRLQREHPLAEFPAGVGKRPHGVAGAFLYGSITRGYLTADDPEPSWEPDDDAPRWDTHLIDGSARWRQRD